MKISYHNSPDGERGEARRYEERASPALPPGLAGQEPRKSSSINSVAALAFDKPAPDLIRNRPTKEGRELGQEAARLCDDAEPRARLLVPDIPPRCSSCAFRAGSHVANGSPATQMDALKCVIEAVPFECHEPARRGHLCSGWLISVLGTKGEPGKAPWPFSDEVAA